MLSDNFSVNKGNLNGFNNNRKPKEITHILGFQTPLHCPQRRVCLVKVKVKFLKFLKLKLKLKVLF